MTSFKNVFGNFFDGIVAWVVIGIFIKGLLQCLGLSFSLSILVKLVLVNFKFFFVVTDCGIVNTSVAFLTQF